MNRSLFIALDSQLAKLCKGIENMYSDLQKLLAKKVTGTSRSLLDCFSHLEDIAETYGVLIQSFYPSCFNANFNKNFAIYIQKSYIMFQSFTLLLLGMDYKMNGYVSHLCALLFLFLVN